MTQRELRIRVHGRISTETAEELGARVERVEDGYELVFDYVDQAQLTGLLVRLSDLHISYDRMEICGTPEPDPGTAMKRSDSAVRRRHPGG